MTYNWVVGNAAGLGIVPLSLQRIHDRPAENPQQDPRRQPKPVRQRRYITLWVTGGSQGQIEETLEQATEAVERYAAEKGLSCSSQKSELPLAYPTTRKQYGGTPNITIKVNGGPIPIVDLIKVLGLWLHTEGRNLGTINALENSAQQTLRLIKRIANRHYGMTEVSLIRLVQAFVISRLVYVAPYLTFGVAEKNKVECIIRHSFKQAIGVPVTTSNEKLFELGLHNTLDELKEAHTTAQYERLTQTPTGRHILQELKIRYEAQHGTKLSIPLETRREFTIPPLPKNMHPEHHKERREARVHHIERKYHDVEGVVYVDAAEYIERKGMSVVAVNGDGEHLASGTVRTDIPEVAEEAAIALAVASSKARIIISGSKIAVHISRKDASRQRRSKF